MAFIDADEFLVLRDINMAAMPQLLKEYTQFGALVVNWQVLFYFAQEYYSMIVMVACYSIFAVFRLSSFDFGGML